MSHFILNFPLKTLPQFETQFVIKFNFHSISIVEFLYLMYYALLLW
jgi:hypothetical protein